MAHFLQFIQEKTKATISRWFVAMCMGNPYIVNTLSKTIIKKKKKKDFCGFMICIVLSCHITVYTQLNQLV